MYKLRHIVFPVEIGVLSSILYSSLRYYSLPLPAGVQEGGGVGSPILFPVVVWHFLFKLRHFISLQSYQPTIKDGFDLCKMELRRLFVDVFSLNIASSN